MLSLQPPCSFPHLRASLGPQFLSSQNSLFNIWPGSILQFRISLDHTLPRPTKPLLYIGLKYWQRGGDRFAVKPALSVNPEKRNCKTCTNDSKAAHEEEEGGEQRGTASVGFRVTFAQPMSIAVEFCLSFSNSIAVHSLMTSLCLNIASFLIHLPHPCLLPPLLLGGALVLPHLFSLSFFSPLLLLLAPHLLLHPPLPLPLQLALHTLQQSYHLLGTKSTVVGCDAVACCLLECGAQRVVLQVQPLQVLQLRKAHWQLLKPVGIEVERLEGLEAAKVLWQLCQAVLAQVQLGDVGEEREVWRQTGQEI